jgi:hypothetical protein
MNNDIYIERFSAWAPGISNFDEWNEWVSGTRTIQSCTASPELKFTDSMFRRRLSQISKMTIQVVHDLLPVKDDTKMIFLSLRGELSKQYSINRMVIEDNTLMPAAFSLSVFNAPIALTSMALGLKGGYSAIYPGKNSFASGFNTAQAALLQGSNNELVLVYADEAIPPEYAGIHTNNSFPFAFGILLKRTPGTGSVPFSSLQKQKDNPENFLKYLFTKKELYVSS